MEELSSHSVMADQLETTTSCVLFGDRCSCISRVDHRWYTYAEQLYRRLTKSTAYRS